MMVETMCGILSGGPFAQHMRKWQTPDANTKANLVSKKNMISESICKINHLTSIFNLMFALKCSLFSHFD